jgi:hypothetical protein
MATQMNPLMPAGLLGLDPEEIKRQAMGNAAIQAGLAGLMASGPSLTPVSAGQVLGQAGMVGTQAYQQGLQQAQQQAVQRQLQSTLTGETGGQPDNKAMADRYRQAATMFAGSDPAKAKLYIEMADKIEGSAPKFTGAYGNVAAELYGDMDVSKLTPEQRSNVARVVQQREVEGRAAAAPKMSVNLSDPTAVAARMIDVRNNYIKETGDASALAGTYKNLVAAAQDPNPINDITLVFGFYKMIDPTSTVREGEYDTLLKSMAIPDRIKNYIQQVQSGEKLTPKMRQEIINAAYNRVEAKKNSVDQSFDVHSNALKTLNVDPNRVLSNPLAGVNKVNIESAAKQQPQSTSVPNLQQAAQEELRRRSQR